MTKESLGGIVVVALLLGALVALVAFTLGPEKRRGDGARNVARGGVVVAVAVLLSALVSLLTYTGPTK